MQNILPIRRREFLAGSMALGAIGAPAIARSGEGAATHRLADEFARIEAESGGRLGIAVRDLATGLLYRHRSAERFPMCSTFKVLACAAVLSRVDARRENLERLIRFAASDIVEYSPITETRIGTGMTLAEICEAAITRSDNTAGNLLLRSLGGPGGVTAYARSIGDRVTRLDRTETSLNEAVPGDPRDTTTPQAMAANLRILVLGNALSRTSRDRLTAWLIANQTGGVRLRSGFPKNWRVGDKTGAGERGTNNDVAVIWRPDRAPLIVCAYLTSTNAAGDARNATLAAVAKAVAATLSG